MRQYSAKQREAALAKMAPPSNMTIPAIAKETGIPQATLYLWRKKARESGRVTSNRGLPPEQWDSETKFRIVVETMPLSEAELGEYCRRKGVYPEQIAEWKQACIGANREAEARRQEQRRAEKDLLNQNKTLKKELRRKERALAETAALLTLRKKLDAVWGEDEDE